jgi:hypothetical protein
MTNGQLASLSWCEAPIWGQRSDFYECQTVAGLLMWSVLSDKRTCLFTIAAGPCQHSHSQGWVPWDSWPYLVSQIWDFSNVEGQVHIFISPRKRVAQLHPQALGSLYVASYDSRGCISYIWHTTGYTLLRLWWSYLNLPPRLFSNGSWPFLYSLGMDRSSIVACASVVAIS